jgi:hypothetical protein
LAGVRRSGHVVVGALGICYYKGFNPIKGVLEFWSQGEPEPSGSGVVWPQEFVFSALQARLDSHNLRITETANRVLREAIGDNAEAIGNNAGAISNNAGAISNNAGAIGDNAENIRTIFAELTRLDGGLVAAHRGLRVTAGAVRHLRQSINGNADSVQSIFTELTRLELEDARLQELVTEILTRLGGGM